MSSSNNRTVSVGHHPPSSKLVWRFALELIFDLLGEIFQKLLYTRTWRKHVLVAHPALTATHSTKPARGGGGQAAVPFLSMLVPPISSGGMPCLMCWIF